MAAKQETVTFESIMRGIKAREFSPIYILMGEESYFIDKICDALAGSVLPEDEREFNQFVVFGSDVNAAQVADMARELPMMSQYKVVIVKEAQNIKKTEELEKYFDHPSPQTVLVYCYKSESIDKLKKFAAKAAEHGVVFISNKVKDRDLPGFITSYLLQHQISIDSRTASVIAESIGTDLSRLVSELDKLRIAISDNDRRVTPELVEDIIGVSKEYNSYEVRNAVVNRDVMKANKIINYYDKNPKAGGLNALVNTLFYYFQNLMCAWYAPDRNTLAGIKNHLELRNEWQAKDYMTGMRNYNAMKTMLIISKLREMDEKCKGLDSGNATQIGLLRELIYFIMH